MLEDLATQQSWMSSLGAASNHSAAFLSEANK
jgi:hypothetical protein